MQDTKTIDIPPMSAKAFTIEEGQVLRVIDVRGGQPGDLVAFNLHDLSEMFGQARTRVENRVCSVTTGHALWTVTVPPKIMLRITKDTGGPHDLLYTPCCRYALETRFNTSRDGCFENLTKALSDWGVYRICIPDPLNLFFNVNVTSDGQMLIGEHTSRPGSTIEMKAEMDCLVAISTCAVPIEGRDNSEYKIQVSD